MEAGNKDFDYAKLEDEAAEEAREDLVKFDKILEKENVS